MKQLASAIFILLFFATVISSCNKKDEFQECLDNPECEYFRCKVNGKEWRPDCESSFLGCDAVDVQYYEETGYLIINAENQSSDIVLYVRDLFEINNEYGFFVGSNTKSTYAYHESEVKQIFPVDTMRVNYINLTKIDKSNLILEGILSFCTQSIDQKEYKIIDGEFRQHYRF